MTNLESVAANKLEGELAELPEVVPGQLALLVIEGKGLGRHNSIRSGALVLEPEHVLLDLRVPKTRILSEDVRTVSSLELKSQIIIRRSVPNTEL